MFKRKGYIWFSRITLSAFLLFVTNKIFAEHVVLSKKDFLPGSTIDFTFTSSGLELSGIFDTPSVSSAKALVIFVHGYGETNIRKRNAYSELRRRFNQIGIATAVWDKPGQGRSKGQFDINQPVSSSAEEVVDAATFFRTVDAPGSDRIGIWGISRAGWIAPLALKKDKNIDFWISVSGTTAEDNFAYLLLSNLPYEGGSKAQAEQLAEQWREGCEVFRKGGAYETYLQVTQALRANEYIKNMRGEWPTRGQYQSYQGACVDGSCPDVDNDMCSYVFVKKFDAMLTSLDVDMLAIFGEKDLNVDWRKTRNLYESTIGANPKASLLVRSFEDADHNLNVSGTGSIKEMTRMSNTRKSEGYYDLQVDWLVETILADFP